MNGIPFSFSLSNFTAPRIAKVSFFTALPFRFGSEQLSEQLALPEVAGLSVTENCNGVTEFSHGKRSLNQDAISKSLEQWMEIELDDIEDVNPHESTAQRRCRPQFAIFYFVLCSMKNGFADYLKS